MGILRIASVGFAAAIWLGCPVLFAKGLDRCAKQDEVILQSVLTHELHAGAGVLVVYPEVSLPPRSMVSTDLPKFAARLFARLRERNRDRQLMPELAESANIHFVSAVERAALFNGVGKDEAALRARFKEVFPGAKGFVQLSFPAISDDGRQALVHLERNEGELSIDGTLHELSCERGKWVVRRSQKIWAI